MEKLKRTNIKKVHLQKSKVKTMLIIFCDLDEIIQGICSKTRLLIEIITWTERLLAKIDWV